MINVLLSITVFLIPFYSFRFSVFGIPTNILEVAVLMFFLVTCSSLLLSRRKVIFGDFWPWFFLLSALTGVIVAGFSSESLGIFKGWFLIPIMFYWSTINLKSKFDVRTIIWPLYASLMVVSIWGILQYLGIIGLLFYQIGDSNLAQYLQPDNLRAFGPFNSPNYLAMYIVPVFFICLTLFRHPELDSGSLDSGSGSGMTKKLIIAASLSLPLVALFLTGSRGGLVALGAGVAAMAVYYVKKNVQNPHQRFFLGRGVVLLIGFVVALAFFLSSSHLGGDEVRIQIWKYSLEMLQGNWLLGIGLGDFQNHIIALVGNNTRWTQELVSYALHPHNIFLAVWLNLGLLGIISFIMILINFFKNVFICHSELDSGSSFCKCILLAAMIAILVHGLFDTTYFKNDLSMIFWLILTLALQDYTKKEITNS